MSAFGAASLRVARENRQAMAGRPCWVLERFGHHNWAPPVRHWWRRFRACASCGHVQRLPGGIR